MQYSTTTKEKSLFEVLLSATWEEFEPIVRSCARSLGATLEVPGFRKGNAPFESIMHHFGAEKIYQEAVGALIEKQWPDIVSRVTADVVGKPTIAVMKLAKDNDVEIAISFIARPAVSLPDYKRIARSLNEHRMQNFEPTEEETNAATQWLLRSRAKYKAVGREAKKGDFVEVNFDSLVEGTPLKGGSSQRHPFILGEGRFMPGFEDALVGLKTGEKKDFSLMAPSDYYRRELADKKVDFSVTMHSVQEVELPHLSDEFAQSVGTFKTKAELETNIASGLTEEKKQKERKEFQERLIEALVAKTNVEIPEPLIAQEAKALSRNIASELEKNKLSFENYLKHLNKTEEEFTSSLKAQATHNLSIAFLFHEIAKKEHIAVSETEIEEDVNAYVKRYPSVKLATKEIDLQHLKTYTENTLLNQKVIRFLDEAATSH